MTKRAQGKKVALVTGASSGIGKSAAILLKEKGYIVYGAARRLKKMKELEEREIFTQFLDIRHEDSIINCVSSIIEKEGRIDVLVNNSGYGSYGAIEDVPIEEARQQFEVNIFGLARITQAVLPSMRQHGFGKIVNISSMAGKIYTPFGGWYHATKHALEGLSDSLRLELEPFGIDVIIIEPGAIKTPWGIIAAGNLRKTSLEGAYARSAIKTADATEKLYSSDKPTKPEVIGKLIVKAVTAKRPKTRYAKGYMAKFSIFFRKWFSDRIFDQVIKRQL